MSKTKGNFNILVLNPIFRVPVCKKSAQVLKLMDFYAKKRHT